MGVSSVLCIAVASPAFAQTNECPSGDPANCHPVFQGCGPATTYTLALAGSALTGTLELANDASQLHLALDMPQGWFVSQIRVHAADGPAPSSPLAYAYVQTVNPYRASLEVTLPMFATCGEVSVVADVVRLSLFGGVVATGTVNLVGAPIPGSTAQSVNYCTSCETCCVASGHFRTHGVSAWAARAADHPAGNYRDAHFTTAFPAGLWIGGTNAVGLLSAEATRVLLSAGGPARQLTSTFVDPSRDDLRNTLAAQLAALCLNLEFDAADASFSPSGFSFGALILARGPWAGLTVREFGLEAAHILGHDNPGNVDASTLAALASTLDEVNENFADGVEAGTALSCPTP